MTIKKMMNESFDTFSLSDWEQKAEEALKGKPVNSLNTNTYENIKLKPLYTKEDFDNEKASQLPGQPDYRRGFNSLGYLSQEWKVAQKIIVVQEGESLREALLTSLEKGQSAIAINADKVTIEEFMSLIEGLYSKFPFSIEINEKQIEFLAELSKLSNCEKISGYIAMDPLAVTALNGTAVKKASYDKFANIIQSTNSSMPNLRTILVNSSVYNHAGANAIQELALALSTGVHHVQELHNQGLKLDTIFSKMVFKFSIGANFFMEIAKLRAARLLWNKVTEAYGLNSQVHSMVITAETAAFTKTVFDPYVNILRAGNEAFAAVLGGIQYLHVSPFNEPEGRSTPFSERIARNTQLILKHEAHLEKVIDPAGGSWYIERLTEELAEKAWALFQEIEDQDGIEKCLASGWVKAQIAEVLAKRSEDIFTRKKSVIGTNVYANLSDSPLQLNESANANQVGIPQVRLSEPFEQLRKLAERIGKAGNKPAAGLICLGELKAHKARKDFIIGFLAPGGVYAYESSNIVELEQAVQFVIKSNLKHYVICGTDKQYDESGIEIISLIKEKRPDVKLYLAGLPAADKQEQYRLAGVDQFIHLRSNCFEILSSLLSEMEVASNE
ncbi:methylmalonyl-CoA mutase family protein [Bacillus sp. JJ1532]|uniref:methylmalonyl-CoA mutase family protein n=1 Tax=Bacillus sp. JJ1532 TaxID=3122958 RepID=UPI002FFE85EB